jgi:hypothetical protein
MSRSDSRKKAAKTLVGAGATAALAVACPPAAVAVGAAIFLKNARKFAQNPNDHDAARGMISCYGDATGGSSK